MYKLVIIGQDKQFISALIDFEWRRYGFNLKKADKIASSSINPISLTNYQEADVIFIEEDSPLFPHNCILSNINFTKCHIKFVVFGYKKQFSLIQKAIHSGFFDYFTAGNFNFSHYQYEFEKLLPEILIRLKSCLDNEYNLNSSSAFYFEKAKLSMMYDFLSSATNLKTDNSSKNIDTAKLGFSPDQYQIIFYEKYRYNEEKISYDFYDIIRASSQKPDDFELLHFGNHNIIILKGPYAIKKLNDILEKYNSSLPPQKNSPLDSIFISCGRVVSSPEHLPLSYRDAYQLLSKRFFCAKHQHISIYNLEFSYSNSSQKNNENLFASIDHYTDLIIGHIQSFNRGKLYECINQLESKILNSSYKISEIKNLFIDLYLNIKAKISFLYVTVKITFSSSSEAIQTILHCYYLYEIITFLTDQCDIILNAISHSSKENIIEDLIYYIEHNYADNITLETIAPLFGYNSSYLGKIFNQKMGINFNAHLDNVRINHAIELLEKSKAQVYKIAELVGYHNVDYFHIKFKKHTGMSPAEYRKKSCNKETS